MEKLLEGVESCIGVKEEDRYVAAVNVEDQEFFDTSSKVDNASMPATISVPNPKSETEDQVYKPGNDNPLQEESNSTVRATSSSHGENIDANALENDERKPNNEIKQLLTPVDSLHPRNLQSRSRTSIQ